MTSFLDESVFPAEAEYESRWLPAVTARDAAVVADLKVEAAAAGTVEHVHHRP